MGRALAERNGGLAEEMVQRILVEVPAYARAADEVADQVLVLATATARAISASLVIATPVRRNGVPIIREQAAHRLHQGIDLDAFLHAYRAALFHYWDACAEEAGRLRLSRAATRAVGRFVLDAIDTITTHAAEAYLREDSRVRTQTGRAVRDLVDGLIAGRPVTTTGRHPVAPGLDPNRPMQAIIARVIRSGEALGSALTVARDVLEENLALGTARPLSTIRHQEVVVIAAGAPPLSRLHTAARRMREEHDTDLGIGVSDAPAGFAGVAHAYAEAALTLSYATATRPVVALAELPAFQLLLLGCGDATRRLIGDKGARLNGLPAGELVMAADTVNAFAAASMNVTRAANALHVHPNTVRYRLARIHETTGLDPRTFAGLTDLHCIIELDRSGTRFAGP